jgi:hypothetical protein
MKALARCCCRLKTSRAHIGCFRAGAGGLTLRVRGHSPLATRHTLAGAVRSAAMPFDSQHLANKGSLCGIIVM